MSPIKTVFVVVFAIFTSPLFGQSSSNASVVFGVVTSFGAPLQGVDVHITGETVDKTLTVKGRTNVNVPYGTYHLATAATAYYWASERIASVIVPKSFVLLVLARKEVFAISGEGAPTPYTISGMVTARHGRANKMFARIRGLYLPNSSEAEIDKEGRFDLAVPFQGAYSIEILEGESVLAAKAVSPSGRNNAKALAS